MTLHRRTMERHVKEEQDEAYLQSLYDDEMKEILRQIEQLEQKEKEPESKTPEPKEVEPPKPTLQELRALRLARFKP